MGDRMYDLAQVVTAANAAHAAKYGVRVVHALLSGTVESVNIYVGGVIVVEWNDFGPRAVGRDIASIEQGLVVIRAVEAELAKMLPGQWQRSDSPPFDQYILPTGCDGVRCNVYVRKASRKSDLKAIKQLVEHLLSWEP